MLAHRGVLESFVSTSDPGHGRGERTSIFASEDASRAGQRTAKDSHNSRAPWPAFVGWGERESPPGHYKNFDLIWPEGFGEALSGSEREWEYGRLKQKIDTDGLSDKYASYLDYAKKGLIPSAGAGLGVERFTRFLVGAKHVGDVQLFRRVPGERVKI